MSDSNVDKDNNENDITSNHLDPSDVSANKSTARVFPLFANFSLKNPETQMKINDVISAGLAVLGIILAYYENEDFYGEEDKKRNESTYWGNAVRGLNMIITIFLLMTIYAHYQYRLKIWKSKRRLANTDTLVSSGFYKIMIIEFAICFWCTPPYLDETFTGEMLGGSYEYSYNACIFCIMLFRVYLLARLFYEFSYWSKPIATKVCAKYKFVPTTMFSIKSEFKQRPFLMIGLIIMVMLVVMGAALKMLEQSYVGDTTSKLDFKYMTNAMWVVIITMTTVGYGDGYPSTHLARMIAATACIFGMLLVSLVVVALTDLTSLSKQETKAFHVLKILNHRKHLQEKGANVIKRAMLFYQAQFENRTRARIMKMFTSYLLLKTSISRYSADTRIAGNYPLPNDEIITSLGNKLQYDLEDIREMINQVCTLKEQIQEVTHRQLDLSKNAIKVHREHRALAEKLVEVHNLYANN